MVFYFSLALCRKSSSMSAIVIFFIFPQILININQFVYPISKPKAFALFYKMDRISVFHALYLPCFSRIKFWIPPRLSFALNPYLLTKAYMSSTVAFGSLISTSISSPKFFTESKSISKFL